MLNGATPTTPLIPTTNEWKQPSQTAPSNLNANSDTVDSIPNLIKIPGVATGVHSTKMDYKRPTREEPSPIANESLAPNDEPKQRERPSISPWPEQPQNHSVAPASVPAAPARVANAASKKIPKESENDFACPASVASAPTTSASPVPSLTVVASDSVNKVGSVTTSSLGVEDKNEAVAKAATKQGIQSGIVAHGSEDSLPVKPSVASKAAPAVSNSTLPQTSHPAVGVPLPAQAPATKTETKPSAAVSQQSTNASQSSPTNVSTQKSPSTAVPPPSQKPSAPSTTSSPPAKSATAATVSHAPTADEKVAAKEEKSNPSTKSKNRGKESPSENADHHGGSKNKSQSFSKNHGADNAKQVNASNAAQPSAKQANGENQETQSVSEGKYFLVYFRNVGRG